MFLYWKWKVAGMVASTVAGGLLAVAAYASCSNNNPEQVSPFGSRAPGVTKETNENRPWSLPRDTPSSKVQWTKPAPGWVKLNVDGSHDRIGRPNSTGCGGVLRDSSGTWLCGFAQKLDPTCGIHEAVIQAILKGLKLARKMNIEKLVVESDNKPIKSMVLDGLGRRYGHPQFADISQIRKFCFEDPKWQVEVGHIPREANQVADRLANDARDLPDENLRKYRDPPTNCIRLLKEDAQDICDFF